MSVLHLWGSREWRGGENQFRLLIDHLSEPFRGLLAAPARSPLQQRLADSIEFVPARCGGFGDLASILAVRRLIRSRGVRLIHAHNSGAHSTALLARAGLGVPLVVSRRNAFAVSSGWKHRAANHHIAVSAAAAQQLARAGVNAGSISIVHDAVDASAHKSAQPQRLGYSPDTVMVLCVAAFTAEKDHALLLEAWRAVETVASNVILVLVGDGPLRQASEQQSAQAGLKRVHFTGWRDDVIDLTHGADLVTLASKQEGLGSSLCEAQMAGKAVAATNAGGIPEAVDDGKTALLSAAGDPQALAENLLALIKDADLRVRMGAAGRARAMVKFHPETIARQHETIYRNLIGG